MAQNVEQNKLLEEMKKHCFLSVMALNIMALCCVSCEKDKEDTPEYQEQINQEYGRLATDGHRYKVQGNTATAFGPAKGDGNRDEWDNMTSYVIPERVEIDGKTYTVTGFGEMAFSGCTKLASITIPKTITTIGQDAFMNCINLRSIILPEGITSIGDGVFQSCANLTSITLPNSLQTLGTYVFGGCSSLSSISIPSSVTSICDNIFQGCTGLSSLKVFCQDINIENLGLYDCKNLTSMELHSKTVTRSGCESLTEVILGEEVKVISEWAFGSCQKLKDIYCYAEEVPETYGDIVNWELYEKATLYVPSASLDAYKAHEMWGQFKTIVAIETDSM